MPIIDSIAYNSSIAKITPRAKLAFGVIVLILCLSLNSFLAALFTIFAMGAISIKFAKLPLKKYIKLLAIPLTFLIIGTITIIFVRYDGLSRLLFGFDIFGKTYGITFPSLRQGALIITKALGAVSCMYFISLNTPMNDILQALREFKLPSLLVSLMELIYRYIFVILDESQKMKIAQDSRLGYRNFKTSMHSMGELVASLFLRTMLRCDRIYVSLQARGYNGDFKSIRPEYRSSKGIWISCAAMTITLLLCSFIERSYL